VGVEGKRKRHRGKEKGIKLFRKKGEELGESKGGGGGAKKEGGKRR